MDTLAHTCSRMGRLTGTCLPAGSRCPHTPLKCLQLGLSSAFSLNQCKNISRGGRQARPGSQEDAGGGLGLEMWKNRDSLPLRICRACPLLLESGSLGNGAADCPCLSLSTPVSRGKEGPWRPGAGRPHPRGPLRARARWPWALQPCPCFCWLPGAGAAAPPQLSGSPGLFG